MKFIWPWKLAFSVSVHARKIRWGMALSGPRILGLLAGWVGECGLCCACLLREGCSKTDHISTKWRSYRSCSLLQEALCGKITVWRQFPPPFSAWLLTRSSQSISWLASICFSVTYISCKGASSKLSCFTNSHINFPRTNLLCRTLPTVNQAAGKTSSMYPFILICSFPTSVDSFLCVIEVQTLDILIHCQLEGLVKFLNVKLLE